MGFLRSKACIRCKMYTQEHDELCGNCLLEDGRIATDYDPWAKAKKARHDAELKAGILNKDEIRIARIEAHDLVSDAGEGLRKKAN